MNELRTFITKKEKKTLNIVFTMTSLLSTSCHELSALNNTNLMFMVKTNFQSLPEFINVFLFLLLLLFFQSNTKIPPLLSKSCLPIFHLSLINGSMLTSGRQSQVIWPNSWSWVQVPPCLHGFLLHVGRRTKSIYMEEKMKFPFASNRRISQDIRDACVFSLWIVSLKSAKSFWFDGIMRYCK